MLNLRDIIKIKDDDFIVIGKINYEEKEYYYLANTNKNDEFNQLIIKISLQSNCFNCFRIFFKTKDSLLSICMILRSASSSCFFEEFLSMANCHILKFREL